MRPLESKIFSGTPDRRFLHDSRRILGSIISRDDLYYDIDESPTKMVPVDYGMYHGISPKSTLVNMESAC